MLYHNRRSNLNHGCGDGEMEMVSHFRRIGESLRKGFMFAMTGSGVACDRGPRPAAAEWGW